MDKVKSYYLGMTYSNNDLEVIQQSHDTFLHDMWSKRRLTCIWEETWGLPGLDTPPPTSDNWWSETKPCVPSEPHKTDLEHFGFLELQKKKKRMELMMFL